MPLVIPLKKNLRVCEECSATYVINGDSSEYWCHLTSKNPVQGKCEFCRYGGKYSLKK
jgi:primosomal protein N'